MGSTIFGPCQGGQTFLTPPERGYKKINQPISAPLNLFFLQFFNLPWQENDQSAKKRNTPTYAEICHFETIQGMLQWTAKQYDERFEGMTEEEINNLSISDYKKLEEKRMKNNAWLVASSQHIGQMVQQYCLSTFMVLSLKRKISTSF